MSYTLFLFLALTVLQYINYINGRPLGRIKYALN